MATRKRFNLTTVAVTLRTADGEEVSVGSTESLSITVNSAGTSAHQAGTRMPVEVVSGTIEVSGSIDRAQTDFDPVNKLINKNGPNPYFNLTGYEKVTGKIMRVKNCSVVGEIGSNPSLSDYATDSIPFNALDYEFQD